MGIEETLLTAGAQNAPLALAIIYAFNRIEIKLDSLTTALLNKSKEVNS